MDRVKSDGNTGSGTIGNGLKIGAAGIAFVAFVVWLVPPTTPKAPDGLARPVAAVRPAVRRAPPSADLPGEGAPDTLGDAIRADVAAGRYAERTTGDAAPIVPAEVDPALPAKEDDSGSADAAYGSGYRWAQGMDVQDRRECRRLERGPARDGCRSYVEDMREDARDTRDDDVG